MTVVVCFRVKYMPCKIRKIRNHLAEEVLDRDMLSLMKVGI